MDAAAAVVVARLDRLAVGVESLVARQQAGVDVEHPVLPSGDEIAAQDAHVAGKRDIVCACGAKLVVDQRVKGVAVHPLVRKAPGRDRSEEHTSELQSLMRISYAVFCLKKKKQPIKNT